MKPFLLACATRNAKYAGNGIVGLQRLVVSNALPKDTLGEVLEAFRECATLALDIQLKILQALPSLLQNYASSLTDRLLLTAFQVCFLLYNSRTSVVSNTAAAALQQLVNSTFEKAGEEGEPKSRDDSAEEVPSGDGSFSIQGASLDAYRLLDDVCLLTDAQRPRHLQTASLAQHFGLELLESILGNHADTIMAHPEQLHILRIRLMPLIIKILSERTSFSTTVRAMRLLQLIIGRLLFALVPECEMALSLLNHMLDPDAAATWKRALCLEVFRAIHSDTALVRSIYAHYDGTDEKRNIVRDHLGNLVRLASEKPTIIGLGQQSSTTTTLGQYDDSGEQATLQAGALVGSIGTPSATTDINKAGISNQWSAVRVPCIEILDKTDAPNLPATYIYSLALTCITSFSEGLARFLLPFTIPAESRAKRKQTTSPEASDNGPLETNLIRTLPYGGRKTPVNPLALKDHVLYSQISMSGHMVEHCWPALLAASSTYLNATMDSENYHILVRSFQKFTQIAGLLDLATPRDAFLTTLGKHAIPALNSSTITPEIGRRGPVEDALESDRDPSPVPSIRRQSTESVVPTMNTRHLLCLRALLNLGIALGPVLNRAWIIILETLLQADLLLSVAGQAYRKPTRGTATATEYDAITDRAASVEGLGPEVTAVETAVSRLLQATSELPGEAFMEFLGCLCSLLHIDSPQSTGRRHRKVPSVSDFIPEGSPLGQSDILILEKLDSVMQSNVTRLLQSTTSKSGWDLLSKELNGMISSITARSEVRIRAAKALNDLFVALATFGELSEAENNDVRDRSLEALLNEIRGLGKAKVQRTKASEACEIEIHRLALSSLKLILEHCGESLIKGWNSVLSIINSIFNRSAESLEGIDSARALSSKLVRSAFDSLQLICSDFLNSVPSSQLQTLLDTLHSFCAQSRDLNISLTTATFFRNVSDHLQRDSGNIALDFLTSKKPSDAELVRISRENDENVSTQALWIYLLLRLELLSFDDRIEVRHSALHTLFRIFDACFDQLTARASEICFETILVRILEDNEKQQLQVRNLSDDDTKESRTREWNETVVVEIAGISELLSQWLNAYKDAPTLAVMGKELFGHFMIIMKRQELGVSDAVFTGTNKVLTSVKKAQLVNLVLAKGWDLWENGNPALHRDDSERQRNDNQEALASYLKCLRLLLRLTGQRLPLRQTKMAVEQIRICVVKSTATAYSTDLDRVTAVQDLVLDCLASIPPVDAGTIVVLVRAMNDLITLPYGQQSEVSEKKQTYIALSKATMSLLESFVTDQIKKTEVDGISFVAEAGNALAKPIRLKYEWKMEGKGDPPWRKATMTALVILEAAMPAVQGRTDGISPFWDVAVKVNDHILSADCDACINPTSISNDCSFDIRAFSKTREILVPALGSVSISDITRRKFAESIFKNSIIHEPNIDDLARPGQELLEGLRTVHIGRVNDLRPSPRIELCYLLLDELFDLAAVHDGSTERVELARAAAPYLILRVGLTLKAYVMDHPLRGRMPQPWTQKREMFYLLRKLIELDLEPKAIPGAPGFGSDLKKHLQRLYPLIMKALKVAWRDKDMTKALQEVLDAVGDDDFDI